jgi:hypothetical protein
MKKKKFNPMYIFPIILGVIAVVSLVLIIVFANIG